LPPRGIDRGSFQAYVEVPGFNAATLPKQRGMAMRRLYIPLVTLAIFAVGFGIAYVIAKKSEANQFGATVSIGGPFSLTDTSGRQVTDRDFRGKLMLVFFGYTHCPDVCPTELQNMADAMGKLGADAEKVAPIFISVDPKRDTVEALANYVKLFGANIVGLTGTPEQVASAAKAYRVYFRKIESGKGDEDYTMDHSAFVYLMDAEGKYLSHFSFQTAPDAMVSVIKKHLPTGGGARS
jgi:protein SCO1/2